MATDTLDSDSARANVRNSDLQRRLDDMVPVLSEALKRINREDCWNKAAAQYGAACAALDTVDADFPSSDATMPEYARNDVIWRAVVDAKHHAMHALLETPAPHGAALVRKLELLAGDDFDASPETLQHLLEDARRLFA